MTEAPEQARAQGDNASDHDLVGMERRLREKWQADKPLGLQLSDEERAMAEKLLGRDNLENLTRYTGKRFKPRPVEIYFEYYPTGRFSGGQSAWRINRVENGKSVLHAFDLLDHELKSEITSLLAKGCRVRLLQLGLPPPKSEREPSLRQQNLDRLSRFRFPGSRA